MRRQAVITISRTQLIVGAAALFVALGTTVTLLLWPSHSSKPGTVELHGTLTLNGYTMHDGAGLCFGGRGYSDITEGAPVTVYDSKGSVVATGRLGRGNDHGWKPTDDTARSNTCWFTFTVSTPHSDIYQVEVAGRGKVAVSSEDAKAGQVALTLG